MDKEDFAKRFYVDGKDMAKLSFIKKLIGYKNKHKKDDLSVGSTVNAPLRYFGCLPYRYQKPNILL